MAVVYSMSICDMVKIVGVVVEGTANVLFTIIPNELKVVTMLLLSRND